MTFKPDVADIRESPALEIIDELAAPGAQVAFCGPHIESLHTPHAGRLESHQNSAGDTWNLILVHTRHAGTNHAWLDGRHTVLDTTRS